MAGSVLFCAIGVPAARALVPALEAAGASVRFADAADAAAAAVRDQAPDTLVITVAAPAGAVNRPLADWALADWMAAADRPVFELLSLLQTLRAAISGRPATVVLVGAALGQTGAGGLVALSAANEGQRGLMKTVARQWGPQMRFAWASVWPPLLFPEIDPATLPEQPELGEYAPPLGGRPGWDEVASTVLALGTLAEATTGQSAIVDGGEWMLP